MNIEKTISEQAVSDILTPMLESQDRIVTEDVAPLFDQATGLDTPPASGTVTTTIEESRNLITAIIRKAWTATLTMLGGASVISYIAAAYTYLRNRLQGNETYGIPDRRSEISASSPLAANLALLNDRKIGGVPEAEDGISLVNLISSAACADVTELQDTNKGWTMTKTLNTSIFPNIDKIHLGAKIQSGGQILPDNCPASELIMEELEEVIGGTFLSTSNYYSTLFPNLANIGFPKLKKLTYASGIYERGWINPRTSNMPLLTDWHFPVLETIANNVYLFCFYGNNTDIKNIYLEKIESATNPIQLRGYTVGIEYLYIGYTSNKGSGFVQSATLGSQCQTIELKDGYGMNLDIAGYNPTDKGSVFLSNFRDYIANRLKGGYPIGQGPILTLSQAVRNAIHAAEATYGIENIIITQKGWTISPAPN